MVTVWNFWNDLGRLKHQMLPIQAVALRLVTPRLRGADSVFEGGYELHLTNAAHREECPLAQRDVLVAAALVKPLEEITIVCQEALEKRAGRGRQLLPGNPGHVFGKGGCRALHFTQARRCIGTASRSCLILCTQWQ